jgi:hypothetical protein
LDRDKNEVGSKQEYRIEFIGNKNSSRTLAPALPCGRSAGVFTDRAAHRLYQKIKEKSVKSVRCAVSELYQTYQVINLISNNV